MTSIAKVAATFILLVSAGFAQDAKPTRACFLNEQTFTWIFYHVDDQKPLKVSTRSFVCENVTPGLHTLNFGQCSMKKCRNQKRDTDWTIEAGETKYFLAELRHGMFGIDTTSAIREIQGEEIANLTANLHAK